VQGTPPAPTALRGAQHVNQLRIQSTTGPVDYTIGPGVDYVELGHDTGSGSTLAASGKLLIWHRPPVHEVSRDVPPRSGRRPFAFLYLVSKTLLSAGDMAVRHCRLGARGIKGVALGKH